MFIVSMLAFFVIVFLLVAITVTLAWMGFLKTKTEETGSIVREQEGEFEDSGLLRSGRLSTLNFWDTLLKRFDFVEAMQLRIDQAHLDWSVGRVTLAMLLCGTVALLVLVKWATMWALLGATLAASAPYAYILHQRSKRFDKFRENFPDALDSLARALRAGHTLSAGMEMISSETLPPVSDEIRVTSAEANLGRGWPQALENLARRMPLLEVNLFIAAVQLHSRTGGKLSEVLGGLSENMREGIALQGEVRSIAAHGKLTGVILTILPIVIAIMMLIVSPGYMQVLFNHPMGKNLITAAVICLVLAHVVIRKIVEIKA
jgi:tight adherence protein B